MKGTIRRALGDILGAAIIFGVMWGSFVMLAPWK